MTQATTSHQHGEKHENACHTHHGGCSCGCSHDHSLLSAKEEGKAWYKEGDFYEIACGGVLFLLALFLPRGDIFRLCCFFAAYLILGHEVLLAATKNICHGHIFDENFLMSIATFGAFALGDYSEGVGIMLFFRIGEFFEEQAVGKSRREIRSLLDLRPDTATLLDEQGNERKIAAKEIKIGQHIIVKAGERIPLDGKIVSGTTYLDTSPLTGEAVPRRASAGDVALSGCINGQGTIELCVEKELSNSTVSRIIRAVEEASEQKPAIERFIARFARYYTPFVVFCALFLAIVPSLLSSKWWENIYISLNFLIISCPCALVLSVPLAFFSGLGLASKKGILIKSGAVLDGLSKVKAVAFDKTGTLTTGIFGVTNFKSCQKDEQEVLLLGASLENASNHPIAKSIVAYTKAQGYSLLPASDVQEIAGLGICGTVKNHKIHCGSYRFLQQEGILEKPFEENAIYIAIDKNLSGFITLGDSLKDDCQSVLKALKSGSLFLAMLTGDGQEGAQKISSQLPLDMVKASLLPEEKLVALKDIRAQKGAVLFVGDGINDAPVLASADVGGAIGAGADAAIEAADIVFMSSRLTAVNTAFTIAHSTRQTARENVILALGVKGAVLLLGAFGFASLWAAVFADTGVALLCILNSMRILYKKDLAPSR